MDPDTEYASLDFDRSASENKTLVARAEELDRQGWELLSAPKGNPYDPHHWVDARRRRGFTGPAGWEYHIFELATKPSNWFEHINSCGWFQLEPPLSASYGKRCLFKRESRWRGSDDGDIDLRLEESGVLWYELDQYFGRDYATTGIIDHMLSIKWCESQARGSNIGTYAAVRIWLAHTFLPQVFKRNNIVSSLYSAEAVLDLILSYRRNLREKAYTPSLAAAAIAWAANSRKEAG